MKDKTNNIPKFLGSGIIKLLPRLVKGIVKHPRQTTGLVRAYNNRGTGLQNPFIRADLNEALKDPELSYEFMWRYNNNVAPDMDGGIELLRDADLRFRDLKGLFPGIDLKSNWSAYDLSKIDVLMELLRGADQIILSYNNKLKFIQDTDSRLFDIVKSSPLYTSLIYSDIKLGKVKDIESYVANLVKQGNTFMRRMDPNLRRGLMRGKPFTDEDFLTITNGTMDVGSPAVVNDPIMNYGRLAYIYMPRFESSDWSLRFPKFKETSITVLPIGMHTWGLQEYLGDNNLRNVTSRYLMNNGVPGSYIPDVKDNYTHMVFRSPWNTPISISDLYIAFPATNENIAKFKPVFGRGLKHGGLIAKMGGGNKVPSRQEIIDLAWLAENPNNRGLLPDGYYEPYPDPNGRDWNVGPGLKVGAAIGKKKKYSKAELDEAAYRYGISSLDSIGDEYNKKYASDLILTPFDTVSVALKKLLLDTKYLNGSIPSDKWPSLYRAVSIGDIIGALRESRSKFLNNGVTYYDNDRVRRRAEIIYPHLFNVSHNGNRSSEKPIITYKKKK